MNFIAEILAASAGADLWKRGRLPANERAAVAAITKHAKDRVTGRARFNLLDQRTAFALLQGDDRGLSGIGSFFKKAVKSVGNVIGDVAKVAAPIVGSTGIPIISNLAGGVLGAGGAALSGDNRQQIAATGGAAAAGQAAPSRQLILTTDPRTGQLAYMPAPEEKTIAGLPEKYLPWVAVAFMALMLRR